MGVTVRVTVPVKRLDTLYMLYYVYVYVLFMFSSLNQTKCYAVQDNNLAAGVTEELQ